MLSTDKQTDKQTDKLTNATKNITSFAKEVNIWIYYFLMQSCGLPLSKLVRHTMLIENVMVKYVGKICMVKYVHVGKI